MKMTNRLFVDEAGFGIVKSEAPPQSGKSANLSTQITPFLLRHSASRSYGCRSPARRRRIRVSTASALPCRSILILLDQQRRLATYDAFVDTAAASVAEAGAARRPISLLVADVDHYRRLAESFGQDYAELVLHTIFDLARPNLRAGALAATPVWEEFVAAVRRQ